jgi:hypothetical protein
MEPAGKSDKQDPKGTLRTCKNGHQYYKSSDCPTCPTCEAERKPDDGFLATLYAPARRALEREGVTTVEKLSEFTEVDILSLHGIGKTALPKLRSALQGAGLKFRT